MTDKIHMEDIENGSIKISNEVIAGIAGMASSKVEGVVGMSGNLAGGITELLGKKNPANNPVSAKTIKSTNHKPTFTPSTLKFI